jgi:predicted DNA-binding transcriptional regulator YafY
MPLQSKAAAQKSNGSKRYGTPRAAGEPNSATERKVRILLEIIRNRSVRLSRICADYGMSERSVLRDFQELRKIGRRAGFTLSDKVDESGAIRLTDFDARPTSLDKTGRVFHALIRDVARALGTPVENELGSLAEAGAAAVRTFLRFAMPTLVEGTRVGEVCKELEAAWTANARVHFAYAKKKRRVEPYGVIQRSGRYYLLARDADAKNAWRRFALDRIEVPITRAGSFSPLPIPDEYSNDDVIGWMKGGAEECVSVWLSPDLAPSAASRQWQRAQRVERHADGSATMTFTVSDADEIVRWALGLGADARVVAPPSAVDRARSTIAEIAAFY